MCVGALNVPNSSAWWMIASLSPQMWCGVGIRGAQENISLFLNCLNLLFARFVNLSSYHKIAKRDNLVYVDRKVTPLLELVRMIKCTVSMGEFNNIYRSWEISWYCYLCLCQPLGGWVFG